LRQDNFSLQNFHGHAEEIIRNLQTICARALKRSAGCRISNKDYTLYTKIRRGKYILRNLQNQATLKIFHFTVHTHGSSTLLSLRQGDLTGDDLLCHYQHI